MYSTSFIFFFVIFQNDEQDSIKQSFQDGVDTLYNACVSAGQTPTDKSPSSIANAIQSIANSKLNNGKDALLIASGVNSSRTINISSYTDDINSVTVKDFIIQITNINAYMTSWGHPSDRGGPATSNNFNPVTCSYSGGNLNITVSRPTYSSGTYGQTGGGNCKLTPTANIYFLKKK